MEYGPRYQRMMAERRRKQEDRESELRSQEDALLRSLDPASVIDDPDANANEEAKEETLKTVQRERQANKPPQTVKAPDLPSIRKESKMTPRQGAIYGAVKSREKRKKT